MSTTIEEEIEILTGQKSSVRGGGGPTSLEVEKGLAELAERDEFDSPLAAAGLGTLRGLTLGGSDYLLSKAGFGESVENYRKHNPISGAAGNITSYVAGPGKVLLKGLQGAAKKVIAGSGVKAGAARGGLALGAEGAVIGAAETVTDTSLSSREYTPEEVAETLIGNMGVGALFGAPLGAAFGGIAARRGLKKAISEVPVGTPSKEQVEAARALGKNLDEILPKQPSNYAGRGVLDEVLPDASQVRNAAREVGIDAVSVDTLLGKAAANAEGVLDGSTSFTAAAVRKNKQKVLGSVVKDLNQSLKVTTSEGAEVLGRQSKEVLIDAFEAQRSNFTKMYSDIGIDLKRVPVSAADGSRAVSSLNRIKLIGKGPAKGRIEEAKKLLKSKVIKTADDIDTYTSELASDANSLMVQGNTKQAMALFDAINALERLEQRTIIRAGVNNTGSKKAAMEFIAAKKSIDKQYRGFRQDLQAFADIAGRKKIKSPRQFRELLEKIPDEQLGQKLINTNLKDSKKLLALRTRNPEVFEPLRQRYVLDMYNKSVVDGELNLLKFVTDANKLSQPAKEVVFTKEGARLLNNLDVLRRSNRNLLKTPAQSDRQFSSYISQLTDRVVDEVKDLGAVIVSKGLRAIDGGVDAANAAAANKAASTQALVSDPAIGSAVKSTDNRIKRAIKNFFEGARKGAASGAVKGATGSAIGTKEQNKKKMDEYSRLDSNPTHMIASISRNLQGIEQTSPEVAESMLSTAMESVSFLMSKMPRRDDNMDSIFFDRDKDYSDAEMATFNRYVRAIENPLSVLEDIELGMITPQAIEAVSTVYPTLMERIKVAAVDEMGRSKPELSYNQKIGLSMLLGSPLSETMKPGFVALMQREAMAAMGEDQQSGASGGSGRTRYSRGLENIARNTETQTQRVLKS